MSTPQPGVFPGATPYPPPPGSEATEAGQSPAEEPSKPEKTREQMGTLALLFLLTSVTLGVATSSLEVFRDALVFFLVLYTVGAWIAFGVAFLKSLRR